MIQLAGEREIKAQIKLRFQSVTGKPIVATRCLQLTQKANKQECKSIDSSLQAIDAKGNVSNNFLLRFHLKGGGGGTYLFTRKSVKAIGVQIWIRKSPSLWVYRKQF